MSNEAMVLGGIVLYGASTLMGAQAEVEHPTPPSQSRLSAHPLPSLGSLAGALMAAYGLSRIKPGYATYALVGYAVSEWYIVPKLVQS